jgi:hypothetical protein
MLSAEKEMDVSTKSSAFGQKKSMKRSTWLKNASNFLQDVAKELL